MDITSNAAADLSGYDVSPPADLQTWYAALANRHYAPANIVCIGDSITEGASADAIGKRWTSRLAANLRGRFPVSGVVGGQGYISAVATTGFASFTWPSVVSGAPSGTTTWGAKRNTRNLVAGTSYTYTVTGTAIDVCFVKASTANSGNVVVDGGAPTAVDGQGTAGGGYLQRISLGASGVHTVVVSGNVSIFRFHGLIVYDGDESAGVRVHECGQTGATTSSWITGGSPGTTGWNADIAAFAPGLIIIGLGVNDATSIASTLTKTNLQDLITYLRAGGAGINPSILIMPTFLKSTITAAQWAPYVAAMKEIAAADAMVSVLDLTTRMPQVSGGTLGLYADTVHPTNKGHSMIADIVADFIAPR